MSRPKAIWATIPCQTAFHAQTLVHDLAQETAKMNRKSQNYKLQKMRLIVAQTHLKAGDYIDAMNVACRRGRRFKLGKDGRTLKMWDRRG